jgi:hypothetical protein
MEQINAYKASDGRLFETADQCQEHEVSLLWRVRIDEFMQSPLCPYRAGTAQAGMMGRMIIAWENFKTGAA